MPKGPELLDEEILEEYFEGLCHGRWEPLLELDLREIKQVEAFSLARLAQWVTGLEQKVKQ